MIEVVAPAKRQAGESVGARLQRLRQERGLSQRALSEPGVSYAYISRIEAGTRQPSVKALRKLAAKLGVSVDYLETGREIDDADQRELRLSDALLALRFGNAAEAEEQLSELVEEAVRTADRSVAAQAQIALALAADDRGDHAGAVAGFEAAFELDRPSPLERLDVFATLGRAYGTLGQTGREIALYEECIDEISRLDGVHAAALARYRIFLSYALSDAGEFSRAEQVLQEALADSETTDDPYMRIRVYWSLARLSEMEGRSTVALRHARRAIALLEATEDDLQRARAHLLAAWIMNSARDAQGARRQLEQAEHLFSDAATADDLAILHVEQARTHALLGDGELACTMAREAIALLNDVPSATAGTAHWALAEGLALQGDPAADTAFGRSVDLLEQNHRWREAAEASRSWAQLLREAGRQEEAFAALERSANFALRLTPEQQPVHRSTSARTPAVQDL